MYLDERRAVHGRGERDRCERDKRIEAYDRDELRVVKGPHPRERLAPVERILSVGILQDNTRSLVVTVNVGRGRTFVTQACAADVLLRSVSQSP